MLFRSEDDQGSKRQATNNYTGSIRIEDLPVKNVYKRKLCIQLGNFILNLISCNNIRTPDSVSYTHLDVYKRQQLYNGFCIQSTINMLDVYKRQILNYTKLCYTYYLLYYTDF